MNDAYICDIPVYRCREQAYYHETERKVAATIEDMMQTTGVPRHKAPESYKGAEEHFRAEYGAPWTFNEVVGWVRLYAAGSHVGAHLWWVESKRLQRKMRKTFYLTTPSNILGTYFTPEDSSEEIFAEILAHLNALSRRSPLKGRYLDLRVFRNVGPFINWRALLDVLPAVHDDRPDSPLQPTSGAGNESQ